MKTFKARHMILDDDIVFTEQSAPKWLTSENTTKGSTMDNRWFWNNHILKLDVGESIQTDFHTITRIN